MQSLRFNVACKPTVVHNGGLDLGLPALTKQSSTVPFPEVASRKHYETASFQLWNSRVVSIRLLVIFVLRERERWWIRQFWNAAVYWCCLGGILWWNIIGFRGALWQLVSWLNIESLNSIGITILMSISVWKIIWEYPSVTAFIIALN